MGAEKIIFNTIVNRGGKLLESLMCQKKVAVSNTAIFKYIPEQLNMDVVEISQTLKKATNYKMLSQDDIPKMIRMRKAGKSYEKIAKKFKVSAPTIHRFITEHCPKLNRIKLLTQEDLPKVIKMHDAGMNQVDMAKELRVTLYSLQQFMRSNASSFAKLSKAKIPEEELPNILSMLKSGKKYDEIAELYGVSSSTIGTFIKKYRPDLIKSYQRMIFPSRQ